MLRQVKVTKVTKSYLVSILPFQVLNVVQADAVSPPPPPCASFRTEVGEGGVSPAGPPPENLREHKSLEEVFQIVQPINTIILLHTC